MRRAVTRAIASMMAISMVAMTAAATSGLEWFRRDPDVRRAYLGEQQKVAAQAGDA
jgi:hypothetical protein